METNTKKVIKKSGIGLALTIFILLSAYYVSPYVNKFVTSENIALFRLMAFGFVAWAVLGRSGFEIQSYKSSSSSEKANKYIYLALYCLGLFGGALGVLVK